ncbi:MAG: Crp/Fnr family transcriptional regulator [Methylobacteriaceae bacterium]|nr:Crp/Fnr family transcriptional regulator [Methylobacteriaceae bacterium]
MSVTLNQRMAVLAEASLLRLLPADAMRILAFSADLRVAPAGETLFRRGEPSDGAYVVMEGSVAVPRHPSDEVEPLLARRGAVIGRAALFARTRRPATAVVREDATLLRVSPVLMRRVLEEYPRAATGMQAELVGSLRGLSRRLGLVQRQLEALAAA